MIKKEIKFKGKDWFVYTTPMLKRKYKGKKIDIGRFRIYVRNDGTYLGDIRVVNLDYFHGTLTGSSYELHFLHNFEWGSRCFYCVGSYQDDLRFYFANGMYDIIAATFANVLETAKLRNAMLSSDYYYSCRVKLDRSRVGKIRMLRMLLGN